MGSPKTSFFRKNAVRDDDESQIKSLSPKAHLGARGDARSMGKCDG